MQLLGMDGHLENTICEIPPRDATPPTPGSAVAPTPSSGNQVVSDQLSCGELQGSKDVGFETQIARSTLPSAFSMLPHTTVKPLIPCEEECRAREI